jgi:hypothetical protein
MANVNAPKGFVPVRHTDGSPWNGQLESFLVPSTDATAIFVGDLVKIAGSAGAAGTVVSGMNCEGMQTVALATAGTTGQDLVGVVRGFLVDPTALQNKHRAASTARIALVVTDPTVVFEAQEDAVGSNIAAADIGLNVPYTTTAGSSTTGVSAMEIDSSAVATTATLPLKILGLTQKVNNAFGLASTDHAKFDVMLNTGIRLPNTAGA